MNGVAATSAAAERGGRRGAGKPRNADTAEMAGKMAIEGAEPLRYNGYKVPLMRNLVKRAIAAWRNQSGLN